MTGLILIFMGLLQAQAVPGASGIVQVAVNYGPRQDVYASGVIAGDGRMVLTDAGVLTGVMGKAREITIAFSDGEIGDGIIPRIQQQNQIAMLPIVEKHGQTIALSPLASNPPPAVEEIDAVAAGQPQPFLVERLKVRARPVGAGAAMRWQIAPPPPAFMRGGPLLDAQDRLIAVIVKEGETLVGMPLGALYAVVEVAAAPPATIVRPKTPTVVAEADATNLTSLLKDTALPPIQVKTPSVKAPAVLPPPTVTALNLPLRASRVNLIPRSEPTVTVMVAAKPPAKPDTRVAAAAKPDAPPPPRVVALNLPLRGPRKGWSNRDMVDVASLKPAAPEPAASVSAADTLRYANELVAQKEYSKAVDVLEAAIAKSPNNADLYFQLGFASWYKSIFKPDGKRRQNVEKSSYHKAIKAFEAFVEKVPRDDKRLPDAKTRLDQLRSAQWGYGTN